MHLEKIKSHLGYWTKKWENYNRMKEISPDMNFFIPIEFEKAQTKKGEKIMKIKGIASTADKDSEGEILEPIGFDLSRFLRDGFLNYNHLAKNDASKIIGEPTLAKVTPKGELYVEGVLYSGHPLAESVWNLAETLERNGSKRRMGFSIEGKALERDTINPKRITKALLTGLAVTPTPVNTNTYLDLVKGEQKNDFLEVNEDDLLTKSDNEKFLYEFKAGDTKYAINKSFELVEIEKAIIPDIEKEKDAKQAKIKKVMEEFKAGTPKTSAGDLVTDRDQALAIALSESKQLDKAMDTESTKPLHPESLDKKVKVMEPIIKKAILEGIIPTNRIVDIVKGGEGSRGGKVIGHTKSGKPIYEKSQNLPYNGFTKQDHLDAAEHHGFEKRRAQDALENTKDFNKRKLLKEKINTHEENERGHITRSNNAKE